MGYNIQKFDKEGTLLRSHYGGKYDLGEVYKLRKHQEAVRRAGLHTLLGRSDASAEPYRGKLHGPPPSSKCLPLCL